MPVLKLQQAVDLPQVAKLHAQWLEQLSDCIDDVTLDAASVQKIDTVGLQLLLSLVRYVTQHQASVCWQQPSEPLLLAARRAGLLDQLQLQ